MCTQVTLEQRSSSDIFSLSWLIRYLWQIHVWQISLQQILKNWLLNILSYKCTRKSTWFCRKVNVNLGSLFGQYWKAFKFQGSLFFDSGDKIFYHIRVRWPSWSPWHWYISMRLVKKAFVPSIIHVINF